MKRFKKRMATIKVILMTLEDSPYHWTPLMKKVLKSSTPWIAQSTLDWLRREGYIERPSRGHYFLTEKGELLLETLS